MSQLIEKIQKAIEYIINVGGRSQYIVCENVNEESVRIRISDHKANPQRMDDCDVSLVINVTRESEEDDNCYASRFTRSKKSFKSIPNQFFLNEDGDFEENFQNLEEFLSYYDINY